MLLILLAILVGCLVIFTGTKTGEPVNWILYVIGLVLIVYGIVELVD